MKSLWLTEAVIIGAVLIVLGFITLPAIGL